MNSKRNHLSHRVSFPFNAQRLVCFYSGRNALWHGIEVLQLASGSEVLLPSYNCGAEIAPFIKKGIRVKLYRIDANLEIDLKQLHENITPKTKAILVTHYFGFPQPADELRKICDERNLYLIEDCAHSLLSTYNDKPLGFFGDISIFSFTKLLPVFDGGALLVNNQTLQKPESPLPPPFRFTLHKFIINLLFGNRTIATWLSSVSKHLRNVQPSPCRLPSLHDYRFDMERVNWGMSRMSSVSVKNLFRRGDVEKITAIRRHNFVYLLHNLRNLSNIRLMFHELTEGVCPTTFPFVVKRRDMVHELLLARGIFTFKTWRSFYPGLPWGDFRDAVYLKNHVISFPLLRSINEKDMHYVLRILREYG